MQIIKTFLAHIQWFVFIYIFWTPFQILVSNLDLIFSLVLFIGFMYFTEFLLG
tara:strand:- start:2319 stop:2477 length:159 start_codon:yes stop_codon:yes gene_type:complete